MGRARRWAIGTGRFLIFAFFFVMILRGVTSTLSPRDTAPAAAPQQSTSHPWPDDEARAYAAQFARAYFAWDPKHPGGYEKALSAYAGTDVGVRVVPEWGKDAVRQHVSSVTVADESLVTSQRAFITVAAATEADGKATTKYLTVPVARDEHGGLIVYDLPSLVSGPLAGSAENEETDAVPLDQSAEVDDLLNRFFTAYLGGDAAAVAAGPALPGTQLGALSVHLELEAVTSTGLVAPPTDNNMDVVTTVTAKDDDTSYQLTYHLRLTKGDRWYVATVNQED